MALLRLASPRFTAPKRSLSTAVNKCRQAIAEKNQSVNAFVYTTPVPDAPSSNLPLSGITVAVKDNIATVGSPTSCSSAVLEGFVSPFDATSVKLLRDAGADIVGKTNCDEFGMGSLNRHSHYGPVINPFQHPTEGTPWLEREKRYSGGSSGGSAAAVTAGMCHAALGTDTGGSIRLPASYCGVVGFKPSYGLISRWGVVSYADSLDCVGILAQRVHDIRRIFGLISSYDPRDPTSATPEIRAWGLDVNHMSSWSFEAESLQGLRIGIPQEYFPAELSPSIIQPIRNVVKALQQRGALVVPVSLPSTSFALSSYYVLASAEASSNMARYDGIQYGLHVRPPPGSDLTKTSKLYALSRSQGFGSEVKRRILLGTYALTADAFDNYFLQAQRVRQLVKNDFNRIFSLPNVYYNGRTPSPSTQQQGESERVDVLIHPSAIRVAPLIESEGVAGMESQEKGTMESNLDSYVQDVLTVPASLAGLPALSIPVPGKFLDRSGDGWPIGVSVVGQWGSDELVMKVGGVVEQLGE